jgi:hypothetical protein
MPKCQFVDCVNESTHMELWRIGNARVFVQVCDNDGIESQRGSRTRIERIEGQAERGAA